MKLFFVEFGTVFCMYTMLVSKALMLNKVDVSSVWNLFSYKLLSIFLRVVSVLIIKDFPHKRCVMLVRGLTFSKILGKGCLPLFVKFVSCPQWLCCFWTSILYCLLMLIKLLLLLVLLFVASLFCACLQYWFLMRLTNSQEKPSILLEEQWRNIVHPAV